jgi:hypothetical protein
MSSDQAKEGSRSIAVGGNVIGSAHISHVHIVDKLQYPSTECRGKNYPGLRFLFFLSHA